MHCGQKPDVLSAGEKFVAFNLSADYCAEHEYGISGIEGAFGCGDEKIIGAERYRITKFPSKLCVLQEKIVKKDNIAVLIYSHYPEYRQEYLVDTIIKHHGEMIPDKYDRNPNLKTAWTSKMFCVVVKNNFKMLANLHELYESMQKLDCMIWLGGGHVFQNSGLCLGIYSRIPEEGKKTMVDAHNEVVWIDRKSKAIEKKFKLSEKVKARGVRFYELRPNRIKVQTDDSKFEIHYWLNPVGTDWKYGWYTVEQLLEFIDGNDSILQEEKTT